MVLLQCGTIENKNRKKLIKKLIFFGTIIINSFLLDKLWIPDPIIRERDELTVINSLLWIDISC